MELILFIGGSVVVIGLIFLLIGKALGRPEEPKSDVARFDEVPADAQPLDDEP